MPNITLRCCAARFAQSLRAVATGWGRPKKGPRSTEATRGLVNGSVGVGRVSGLNCGTVWDVFRLRCRDS